jgi:osmoprotectant transport system ATP-binding protein
VHANAFENKTIYPCDQSGSCVAALMARHLGWPDERIATRINELAELTHFPTDALDRYPLQLSGGQQQRVSLMRALMLDPEVLLDEPLGALDPMIRLDLQADLRDIFTNLGKTVLMVTHDLGEAVFFADIIVLLRDGRIVQQDAMAQLLLEPEYDFVRAVASRQ